jgi:hypothetical protein
LATPRKGKAKVKITASGKRVSYGQAGSATGGGPRVKPGTSKGDSYCARSLGIRKDYLKKNKTTLTLQTIYQEKDGNVLEQNLRESNGWKKRCLL